VSKRRALRKEFSWTKPRAGLWRLNGPSAMKDELVLLVLYGSGLRLMEGIRLRVKDLDFERNEIMVREGKGAKDRVTMLPDAAKGLLQGHLKRVRALHRADLQDGFGKVHLPSPLSFAQKVRSRVDAERSH
jgi:integrase